MEKCPQVLLHYKLLQVDVNLTTLSLLLVFVPNAHQIVKFVIQITLQENVNNAIMQNYSRLPMMLIIAKQLVLIQQMFTTVIGMQQLIVMQEPKKTFFAWLDISQPELLQVKIAQVLVLLQKVVRLALTQTHAQPVQKPINI